MRPRKPRTPVATAIERMAAVMSHPAIYLLGDAIPDAPIGRRRHHPNWMLPAYLAMTRIWASSARLDAELRTPGLWDHLADIATATQNQIPDRDPEPLGSEPYTWDHYRQLRNRVTGDEHTFNALLRAFTDLAVADARTVGLLDPDGPGSLTHPDPSRTIFGDGTVVRPIYKARPGNPARVDPDAAVHHRHDGPIHGNDLVAITCRGPASHQRVVLAVGRVDTPGREAETALELIDQVHAAAGAGIQAVVYDGALRGRHHQHLMAELGVVPINKVAAAAKATDTAERVARRLPLGVFSHATARRAECRHQIASIDGALVEIDHDDTGELIVVAPLARKQIKRARRSHGDYHFTIIATVDCPDGPFDIFVSPHPEKIGGKSRPDLIRLIPQADPDFAHLYGLRNDSETLNSMFKRSLLIDRATSLGWRRQVLDLLGFSLLTNATALHHHRLVAALPTIRRAS